MKTSQPSRSGSTFLALLAAGALGCGSSDGPGAASVDAPLAPDARPADGGADSADGQRDAAPATLSLITVGPLSAARGAAVSLTVTGTGFAPDAVVVFGGQPLPTSRQSDTRLTAEVTGTLTMQAGYQTIWVANGRDAAAARSNLTYFSVSPPPGAPEVLDFQPDNGVPGDKIQLVGFNLSSEPLQVTDSQGHMTTGAAIRVVNSLGAVLESVEVTVPADWQSGPLTVATSVGSFRAKAFTVGRNLARVPGAKPSASSEYGGDWTIARGADNDLLTAWFPIAGQCVTAPPPVCMSTPWYMITFPSPQTVTRIAMRGSREYSTGYSGYNFLRGRFEVFGDAAAVLWSGSYDLPEPDRDLDIVLPTPVPGALSVRFTSEKDESEDPGLGELEIF
jgi:hypothetical protein